VNPLLSDPQSGDGFPESMFKVMNAYFFFFLNRRFICFVKFQGTKQGPVWWYLPMIPATQKAVVRGSQFEASLGKVSVIPYLTNKLKTKRTWGMAQEPEPFLAIVRY
jgi:hypothetical protein